MSDSARIVNDGVYKGAHKCIHRCMDFLSAGCEAGYLAHESEPRSADAREAHRLGAAALDGFGHGVCVIGTSPLLDV